ncbi:MAG TPA: class I SAM-dependent methyltransferase [Planctomycetota bacterium]|nr:class I SAM-dependent methyltransferase [Planctomycetota bacterium]
MPHAANSARTPAYGVDAGYLIPLAGLLTLGIVVTAAALHAWVPLIAACTSLSFLGTGLHTSRRGKFLAWEEVLDELHLRGDERVLDLGCGRGAVLMAAARRLTSGRGVGVDIWSRADQSGNLVDATLANAEAEGVAARVTPLTADMRALPFLADSFDVVVSNVAIHNIRGARGRAAAIDEAARVLRPGGRLLVADLAHTSVYSRRLGELGLLEIGRRSLGWRMWWSGPWRATYLVTATKPEAGSLAAAAGAH